MNTILNNQSIEIQLPVINTEEENKLKVELSTLLDTEKQLVSEKKFLATVFDLVQQAEFCAKMATLFPGKGLILPMTKVQFEGEPPSFEEQFAKVKARIEDNAKRMGELAQQKSLIEARLTEPAERPSKRQKSDKSIEADKKANAKEAEKEPIKAPLPNPVYLGRSEVVKLKRKLAPTPAAAL